MGRRHSHLAKRVDGRWLEACREKYLRTGYVGKGPETRKAKKIPYHLGMTDNPVRVTCRACLMLLAPEIADVTAAALERGAMEAANRIDTVVLLVTREEVFKIRVPALEPSSERAEIIATAMARGRGAVAARTKVA
jgi:hypothetical protein